MDLFQLPELMDVDEINNYFVNTIDQPLSSEPCQQASDNLTDIYPYSTPTLPLCKCSLYLPTSFPVIENQQEWMIHRGYLTIPETRQDKINRYLRKRAKRIANGVSKRPPYQRRSVMAKKRKRHLGRFVSVSIFPKN